MSERRSILGLRESKKQQTRKAISDMATLLFFERGYHEVTTAEIAQRAEVSVPTLFNYFSSKEALLFDEDSEMEEALVNCVLHRQRSQSILDALLEAGFRHIDHMKGGGQRMYKKFTALVEGTPELSRYAKQMWLRHEKSLAQAIRKEAKEPLSATEAEAIAHFVLDSYHRSIASPNPKQTLEELFGILRRGWNN